MNKHAITVLLCLTVASMALTGCRAGTPVSSSKESEAGINKQQMVTALNPVLKFNDETVVAYNDIKNAIKSDGEEASLTSMYDGTSWQWGYRQSEDSWKGRGIYTLARWTNGQGVSADGAPRAYSFVSDDTISVASYAVQSMAVEAYADEKLPDMGILASVSGDKEEALCYMVTEDGSLTIAEGVVTAVESVEGVATGFLTEDGTARRGAVRIHINNRELWSGQLANATASGDGTATTELSYPEFKDIIVKQGDMVIFSFELDAAAETVDGAASSSETAATGTGVTKKPSGSSSGGTSSDLPAEETCDIPLIDGYDSRFVIIRGADTTSEMLMQVTTLRGGMIDALETDQPYKTDVVADTGGYEILIGLTNRPESAAVLQEITDARVNHATDYIIRMVGKKLVFAAGTEFAMSLAVEYFLENYCQDDKASVPSDLNIVYRPKLETVMLGNTNIASFTLRTEKYPSYLTTMAAQDLQKQIMRQTGYKVVVGKDTESSAYEIRLGPSTNDEMNPITGKRDYAQNLLDDTNAYSITLSGSRMTIAGGSTTAVNEAVQALVAEMAKGKTAFPDGYTQTGSYAEGAYSLSDGYGLTWFDDFSGDAMTKKWHQDTETLPAFDGTTMIKNGIFGEDYFLRSGYLVQTTRKRQDAAGYHVVRTTTQNLMNFRYGYLEVRLIMPTDNGACGAVWMEGKGLNQVNYAEIDMNENYGIDGYQPNLHSWPTDSSTGDAHWQMWAHDVNTWETEENWVYPAEGEHFYDTFHYLGMDWTEDYIAFYLDGEITKFVDMTSAKFDVFEQSVVLKLGTMVAFDAGYGIMDPPDYMDDVNGFYEEAVYDFVRIYQKDDSRYKVKTKG